MVNNVLKYKTGNLIILYYYIYSRLLKITEVVIQNSMKLIRDTESGPWVNE